jgi:hypothetical protein
MFAITISLAENTKRKALITENMMQEKAAYILQPNSPLYKTHTFLPCADWNITGFFKNLHDTRLHIWGVQVLINIQFNS